MKIKAVLLTLASSVFLASCGTNAVRVDNAAVSNSNLPEQSVIAHSNEPTGPGPVGTPDPSQPRSKWTQSGTPIDTTKFDAAIASAQAGVKRNANGSDAKKALAKAYFDRGMALTEARQYPSALGDYRKAVELDPELTEAKTWVDQIMGIYASMNREPPKAGEEPPPLPFAQRIEFEKGAVEKTVSGELDDADAEKTFVISVREGQTLTTRNSGRNYITIAIKPPAGSTYEQDMAADCHDRNEVKPTAAGDYTITVTECKKADAWKGPFKFLIAVR